MSSVSPTEIKREFMKSKIGLIGVLILLSLVILSVVAITTIPIDTFKQWNNPGNWISYPKTSAPVWVNYFVMEKIPEHLILDNPTVVTINLMYNITMMIFQATLFMKLMLSIQDRNFFRFL